MASSHLCQLRKPHKIFAVRLRTAALTKRIRKYRDVKPELPKKMVPN
jgi:hypothetical protein